MKKFSPSIAKKAMTVFQDAYPTNPKAMYFLGMPSFFESAFNVMKGFMKDKMKNRLHVKIYLNPIKLFRVTNTRYLLIKLLDSKGRRF